MTTPANPDFSALPAALREQIAAEQMQPQQQSAQPQQPQQSQVQQQPQQSAQPQQAQQQAQTQQPQAPTGFDPELEQFMVDVSAAPAPQTHGFSDQQQPAPQTYTQTAPQPGAQPPISDDRLARVEQAQYALMQALQQNMAGRQTANQPTNTQVAQQAQQPTPEFQLDFGETELTADEQKFVGDHSAVFEKLAARRAKAALEPVLRRLAEQQALVDQRLAGIEQSQQGLRHQTFRQVLAARVPDFETIAQQPQFAAYLREVLPEVGVARADVMRNAIQNGNIGLIEHHLLGYKQRYGGGSNVADATAALRQPTVTPRGTTPTGQQPVKQVTEHTLLAAEDAMMKGKLAPEKLEKLVAIFRQQQQAGTPPQRGPRF